MNTRLQVLSSTIFAMVICSNAFADTHRVDLGWGNITPCSTLEWTNDGFLGTPSPTYRQSPQRVMAYALIDAPTLPGIQNDLQQCALQGAGAAGLSAIVASPAAAMPTFQATFGSCMANRSQDWGTISLNLSEGQCM